LGFGLFDQKKKQNKKKQKRTKEKREKKETIFEAFRSQFTRSFSAAQLPFRILYFTDFMQIRQMQTFVEPRSHYSFGLKPVTLCFWTL